jgi:hypothetical protein
MALITNKNKPNVKNVIGKVKSTKMGFTKRLSKPSTAATIIAVANPATCTPVKKCDKIKTMIAVTKILYTIFIF